MSNIIRLEQYRGSNIEKGFTGEIPNESKLADIVFNTFNKGLITQEVFEKALDELPHVKGILATIGEEKIAKGITYERTGFGWLEKGVRPKNPNLKLVHITDKNGVHRVVWKLPEEIEGNKSAKEVKKGDKVTVDGKEYTVRRVSSDGYVRLQDAEGNKMYRSVNKMNFHHPETGKAGGQFDVTGAKESKPKDGQERLKEFQKKDKEKTEPENGAEENDKPSIGDKIKVERHAGIFIDAVIDDIKNGKVFYTTVKDDFGSLPITSDKLQFIRRKD